MRWLRWPNCRSWKSCRRPTSSPISRSAWGRSCTIIWLETEPRFRFHMATKSASHASDRSDLYGGLGLALATLAALVVANSALHPYYAALLHLTGEVRIG